jgi:hypothetical protein
MQDSFFGDVIYSYTRADALADGTLHDTGELAAHAGFLQPLAIAPNAWADAIAWPHDDSGQDETGRIWDVLTIAVHTLRQALARNRSGEQVADVLPFTVHRIAQPGEQPTPTTLTLHIGPGDDGEPVLTICAPLDL